MNTYQLKQFIQNNNPHPFAMVWGFSDSRLAPFSHQLHGDFRVVHPDENPEVLTADIVKEAAGLYFWLEKPDDVANLSVLSDASLGFDRTKVVVGASDPSLLAGTAYAGKGLDLAAFRDAMVDASKAPADMVNRY